jgi:hypothetical protein
MKMAQTNSRNANAILRVCFPVIIKLSSGRCGGANSIAQLGPLLIPRHLDGLVVAAELLAVEPQLEAQVGGGDDGAHLEVADVELLAAAEARAALLLQHQLAVLHARQIALDGAELLCAG